MLEKIAVYPGTFDPVTLGHLDIVERAIPIFDRVIVAVAKDTGGKPTLFSIEERIQMLKDVTMNYPKTEVHGFSGLLITYVKEVNACTILRGLRAISDFEHEFQMASINKRLNSSVETLFMMTNESYFFLSSSSVKEIAALGCNLKGFVPELVEKQIKKKLF
ncbi:pantetheine-phosphate adenylyltransferase [bacterium]|nr:pantetheine-phosphate adenylyltransferase [bacterium]MBU1753387.1 pantetheine-phosphate adenylyltransferase [bacterium]